MMIRAVVFDIGGVLELGTDGREPMAEFGELISDWEKRSGVAKGQLGAVIGEMYSAGACGTCSERDWWEQLRQRTGMSTSDIEAFASATWSLYLGEPNHELLEYFSGLRSRFRLALLSNSFVGAREREEARFGFSKITEHIVYSHEVGLLKPDPRIYELTCERIAVPPSAALFVDDRQEHVEGARAVGMTAVRFRGNASLLAELGCLLGS